MMFTKIRLVGRTNVDFPIVGAKPSDPYILKAVDGLGPPEGDVSIVNTSQGGVYQGRRPQLREPVARVGLNPSYALGQTVGSLREQLYGLLSPSGNDERIDFQLMNGAVVVAHAYGYVKRIEINPFTKEPEAQITIACISPYLSDPNATFATPEMTYDSGFTYFSVLNGGSAPSGFALSVIFTADHSGSLQIFSDASSPFSPILSILHSFVEGDSLTLNTVPGSISIMKTPPGGSSDDAVSILGSYSSGPWLQLHSGLNNLKINSPDLDWVFGLVYTPQYWGI